MTVPRSEFSDVFVDRMRMAMEMSFHKYGPISKAFPHKIDAIGSLQRRLDLYERTGNMSYLIDVANFAMIELMLPAHESPHYSPTDGGEGRKWHAGGAPNEKDNAGTSPGGE